MLTVSVDVTAGVVSGSASVAKLVLSPCMHDHSMRRGHVACRLDLHSPAAS